MVADIDKKKMRKAVIKTRMTSSLNSDKIMKKYEKKNLDHLTLASTLISMITI